MTPNTNRPSGHFILTDDGERIEVLSKADFHHLERRLMWWLLGSAGAVVVTALALMFSLGTWTANVRSGIDQNAAAVAEVKKEGSQPVKDLQGDFKSLTERMNSLSEQMARLERQLDRRY